MKPVTVSCSVLEQEIRGELTELDSGYIVTLLGGCRTHVGAVTAAEADGAFRTLLRPGHREELLSERWAAALSRALKAPVTVLCGIHYDNPGREDIDQIVKACDRLLEQLLTNVEGSSAGKRT